MTKMCTLSGSVSGRRGEGRPLEDGRRYGRGRYEGIQPQPRAVGAPGSREWAGGLWAAVRWEGGPTWVMVMGALPPPSTESDLTPVGLAGPS